MYSNSAPCDLCAKRNEPNKKMEAFFFFAMEVASVQAFEDILCCGSTFSVFYNMEIVHVNCLFLTHCIIKLAVLSY